MWPFDRIFEGDRLNLANNLLSDANGYAHYEGSALVYRGKAPIVVGGNHVVRCQGFGRLKSTAFVAGEIKIDQMYLGMFNNLSVDINAPIGGDVRLEKLEGNSISFRGKLSVHVIKPLGSLTIVDNHEQGGKAKNMKITLAWPNAGDIRIEICGKSPEVGFSFNLHGPVLRGFRNSNTIQVISSEEQGTKVYRIYPAK
jgi:hypothetical protein